MDFNPLIDLCNHINIQYEIEGKTAPLNSFRVGQHAKLILYPDCINSFCEVLDVLINNNYKYVIIGNGTNVYFCDYYDGIVIVTKKLNVIQVFSDTIVAMCGADISKCAQVAYDNSLEGLEFAYGIPGTVGGATYINASAFGSSASNIISESLAYDKITKDIKVFNNYDHQFSTKASVFSKENRYVILKTTFKLKKGSQAIIKEKMDSYIARRRDTQPLSLPSAGSVFIKPDNCYASKLIDEAGLKGFRIGGVEVSKKHAGFFVNIDHASADDINALISKVKMIIKDKYNIQLKEEIIYIE